MKCIIKEKWRFNITDSQISEFSLKDFYMRKKSKNQIIMIQSCKFFLSI